MSRLIDDLRAAKTWEMPRLVAPEARDPWEKHARICSGIIGQNPGPHTPAVFDIDNVADWYYSNDQEYWDLTKDFPNLAPPLELMWFECHMPKRIWSKEKGESRLDDILTPRSRKGVLMTAYLASEARAAGLQIPGSEHHQAHWILVGELFLDYGQGDPIQGPHFPTAFAVDKEGHLVDGPSTRPFFNATEDPARAAVLKAMITYYHPALLSICFMHCHNVRQELHTVDAPLAKRYGERHAGLRPDQHRVLVIDPMKAVLRQEGKHGAGNTAAQALHICRGHFKHFEAGKGLFGKLHGTFWWPQHRRGSQGEPEKMGTREYVVKAGESRE